MLLYHLKSLSTHTPLRNFLFEKWFKLYRERNDNERWRLSFFFFYFLFLLMSCHWRRQMGACGFLQKNNNVFMLIYAEKVKDFDFERTCSFFFFYHFTASYIISTLYHLYLHLFFLSNLKIKNKKCLYSFQFNCFF